MDELLQQVEAQIGDWAWAGMSIGEVGNQLVSIRLLKERLEAIISRLNEATRHGSAVALEMLLEADLPGGKIVMENGYTMLPRQNVNGEVINPSVLAGYLIETGESAIGKIQVPQELLTDEQRSKLISGAPGVELKIHAGTWGKWIRDRVENEKIDPLEPATWPPGVEIKTWSDVQIRKNPSK